MGSIKKGRGKRPFLMLLPREARRKSTRSVLSRQGRTFCSDAQKLATGNFLHVRAAFSGGHAAFLCCLRQPTAALRRPFAQLFVKHKKLGKIMPMVKIVQQLEKM